MISQGLKFPVFSKYEKLAGILYVFEKIYADVNLLLKMQVETGSGTLIAAVSGFLQYCITKDALGKFISFQCTPVRDDGTVGEPRTCLGPEPIRPGNFFFLK